ncbi:bifunctional lysylphosphatidylglycerol synthetase/lysine--tRNA ligase LysX [Actinosynnema mirum]|uniref:Lysine--tRNA ligase n=1 Tax=Actinosynnema mirum (strain ATCC 29888 / DSM 43827 / JCM 3225 / NBRC 14064 / NCIMB 13271 / NRRL B-12336 / IMRU 3971 / 101) TaxID=446462 RepID=C6WMD2_ACTMD|nr:bifunctional lysylphosphatidylglycerol synthetase/lysine--tRNA ligase LysX [Actinosynnema mirum]ACU34866.1 lysyl-tRNA synthetase [Actinosynnema mirum DSM 43827]
MAVAGWKWRAAGVVATVVQVSALASLVLLLWAEGTTLGDVIFFSGYALGLPVEANLFIVLVLVVLGAALRARKRAALWALLLTEALGLAWNLAVLLLLAVAPDVPASGEQVDWRRALGFLGGGALTALVIIAFLLAIREAFPAELAPGAWRKALAAFIVGLAAAATAGFLLTEVFPGSLRDQGEMLVWAANQVSGEVVPLRRALSGEGPAWLSVLLGVTGTLVAIFALYLFFRGERSSRWINVDEELTLRRLLAAHGEPDSLGYFATRRDKSAVLSPDGRAALTYRVLAGTTLASGDPVGDEDSWRQAVRAWLDEARRYGWRAGVLGASERGARAYAAEGLKALEIGDEAVLDVREFSLAGPERRAVRQAVSRVERAGYTARVRRHAEIPADEMAGLLDLAQRWRGAQTERGFSMALGRLGDESDGRCAMVEAYDADGALRGLLSFVPWGRRGLSLDLMRRDRTAENGLNEFMVAELVAAAGRLGVQRVSLNFAMFRAVFEEGEKLGAGPVLRAWRGVLGLASRFLQLESLYRSNAKYGPDWQPRYLCYSGVRSLPRVSVAAGVAEGFVPNLRSLLKRGSRRRGLDGATTSGRWFADAVREIEATRPEPARARRPEQVRVRMAKLDLLRAAGRDPYPVGYDRDCPVAEVESRFGQVVAITGRVVALRELGGLCFARVRDWTGEVQVMLDAATTEDLHLWKSGVDLGDHVGARGEVVRSRRGELSVLVADWAITAKCLHPLPDRRAGLADPEARVRKRYLDLAVNPDSAAMLRTRSAVVRAVRDFLHDRGYLEVETPMLQTVHGGANARPFVTHINAYDTRMYLRIAPELYLKRLCVAGVDRVFELNRNFRNEGADATHNPEFTMLEAYQAYADYRVMLDLVRELVQHAAVAAHGRQVAVRDGAEVDISGEWPVVPVHAAVSTALGVQVGPDLPLDELRAALVAGGVPLPEDLEADHGTLVLRAYDHLVEPATTAPTFYTDFPTSVSPLTREHRADPRLAERWDLVAFGAEVGTAYSELTDPVEQRRRLEAQSLKAASGDVEAMELDEDFLAALEHGMAPTGGLGLGVDRLLMMLTGASIRQTVLFPFVRPGPKS